MTSESNSNLYVSPISEVMASEKMTEKLLTLTKKCTNILI
jgi:hypothetical protein